MIGRPQRPTGPSVDAVVVIECAAAVLLAIVFLWFN